MRANAMCMACMVGKQEKLIRPFGDEGRKSEYMHKVLGILCEHGRTESSPWLAEQIDRLYENFWEKSVDYTPVKQKYNQLLLDREGEIGRRIRESQEPVKECIKYVCAANYIDFSAVENVNRQTFETLLEKAGSEQVPDGEYREFTKDLEHARTLAYLVDNCGEIVLDKVFMKCLKETYPQLQITAIVRGRDVLNDATMDDARETGLTELVTCMGNGSGAPGTVLKNLSQEARRTIMEADVVISKGQGNFESLFGEGLNPYYLFLCKCELFVRRFGLKQYQSVFSKEERVKNIARRGAVTFTACEGADYNVPQAVAGEMKM